MAREVWVVEAQDALGWVAIVAAITKEEAGRYMVPVGNINDKYRIVRYVPEAPSGD